jgi:hypothetical protein
MRDFEKDLSNLPDPDIRVDEFQRTLRRELIASMEAGTTPRFRLAFSLASAAAGIFAALLVLFVVKPGFPAQIHDLLLGGAGPAATAEQPAGRRDQARPHALAGTDAGAQVDQAFVESWYQQRARPVQVKSMQDERFLAIRQFELSSGERVVVFTELGNPGASRSARTLPAAIRTF